MATSPSGLTKRPARRRRNGHDPRLHRREGDRVRLERETDGRKSVVRFELEPSESDTKLTLTHSLLDDDNVPGYAATYFC